jgi:DNA polymerase-3 subunit gamma/tau
VDEVVRAGYDLKEFACGIAEHLRNLLIAKSTESTRLIEASDIQRKRYAKIAEQFTETDILRLSKLTTDAEASLRYHSQPRFALEVALVQMAKIASAVEIGRLLQDINELKNTPRAIATTAASAVKSAAVGEKKISYTSTDAPNPFEPLPVKPATGQGVAPSRTIPIPAASKLSFDQVRPHWSTFVDQAKKGKIGVGTILAECSLLDVQNGAIRIACGDDYHLSTLRRNQQYLTQLFCGIAGISAAINLVLHKTDSAEPSPLSAAAPVPDAVPAAADKIHPFVAKLVRDFGAERV